MTRYPEIGERKQSDDFPVVLLEFAIAEELGKTKLLLDDSPDSHQNPVKFLLLLSQLNALGILGRYQKGQTVFAGKMFDGAPILVIAATSEENFLLAVQAVFEHDVVGHFGGGAFDGMNQLTIRINTNMGFYTKVPLVIFLRLTHLGIGSLVLVLGGARGSDQSGINDGATLHAQTLFAQDGINSSKRSQ